MFSQRRRLRAEDERLADLLGAGLAPREDLYDLPAALATWAPRLEIVAAEGRRR